MANIEKYDPQVHTLCVNTTGEPVRDLQDPNLLAFLNKTTNSIVFLEENNEISQMYPSLFVPQGTDCQGVTDVPQGADSIDCDETPLRNADTDVNQGAVDIDSDETPLKNAAKWHDDAAVKYLIHLRKVELKTLFQSTALSNMRKWQKLASELAAKKPGNKYWSFTWKQCEGKWKDLVKNYNKAKDNMGAKNSGAAPIRFKFFDDMDEVNRSSPTVKPVSVASNLDPPELSPTIDSNSSADTCTSNTDEPDSKRKKTKLEKKVDVLIETVTARGEEKEAARKRRHKETLAIQKTAVETYKDVMNRLIDKL